jgi:beta-glucosidase/6-phospho-beta-glucosidase/beta-galactosidase
LHVEGAIKEDGRGQSIWDTFTHTPGKTPNGDTDDVACDEYNLYPKAFDLMAEMGLKVYRLSIAWPRIQPDGRGAINHVGLDHYNRIVDALLERDIAPLVTSLTGICPRRWRVRVVGPTGTPPNSTPNTRTSSTRRSPTACRSFSA